MTSQRPIRVLCVDDHPIVREGVVGVVSDQPDMKIVGAAASGEEALALFSKHKPDITLMDLRLRTMSGLEAIKAIRRQAPAARIIVLTMYEGDEDIHRALAAGAATYLLKETLAHDLVDVIRAVHRGEYPILPDVKARLEERAAQATLTPREVEVIELVAEGKRNKEISSVLGITEDTVEAHLRNIYLKLNVSERTAAVRVAARRGYVHVA
jgi:DNA-binding NarL/FixJ family response regulator